MFSPKLQRGDKVLMEYQNGRFVQIGAPLRPEKANFVIVCAYGDWSGFRTWAEIQATVREFADRYKADGFFAVVER